MEQKVIDFLKVILSDKSKFAYWFGRHFESFNYGTLKTGDLLLVKTYKRVMDDKRFYYGSKATYHNETDYQIVEFISYEVSNDFPNEILVKTKLLNACNNGDISKATYIVHDGYSFYSENGEGIISVSVGKFVFSDKDIEKVMKAAAKEAKLAEELRIQAAQLAIEQARQLLEIEEQERRDKEEAERLEEMRLNSPAHITIREYEYLIQMINDLSSRLEEVESSTNGLRNRIYGHGLEE